MQTQSPPLAAEPSLSAPSTSEALAAKAAKARRLADAIMDARARAALLAYAEELDAQALDMAAPRRMTPK